MQYFFLFSIICANVPADLQNVFLLEHLLLLRLCTRQPTGNFFNGRELPKDIETFLPDLMKFHWKIH